MTTALRRTIPVLMATLALAHAGCTSKSTERAPTGPQAPIAGEEWQFRSMAEPPLGFVRQFGILASAGVTANGTAVVAGDVGSCPTPSITGAGLSTIPPFIIHPEADAVVCQAQTDATAASTNLLGQGPGALLAAQLGGTAVGPGVYSFASTADIAVGTVFTLTGAGSYVFLVPSSLTANVLSSVVLVGVDPCQVFWRVGSDATLNGVNFPGTVIAGAAGAGSVTIGSGMNLAGRAVSLTGAVTMPGTGQFIGGCSALVPGGGRFVPALPFGLDWALLAILVAIGVYVVSRSGAVA
jgi:hypothetical protein